MTGRYGLGEVVGLRSDMKLDRAGKFRRFEIRLSVAEAERLAKLLRDATTGLILATTADNMHRMRVIADPAPQYERNAPREAMRGDIARVVGSARSANVLLTVSGAAGLLRLFESALPRAGEWIAFRAAVAHRGKSHRSCMLMVSPDADIAAREEQAAFGKAGLRLAGETLTAEEFTDWDQPRA